MTARAVCWVARVSGEVLVLLNDSAANEKRLAAAALVYGLTPGQLRVATRITAGDDIVAAARRLGISVNTARTHLRRIYDRTGVRSQTALMRALLSAAQPPG